MWELTRLHISHNKMMAASSSTPPLSVSSTPGCPNLLHKHPDLISSHLSIPELCELFNDFICEDCPWRNCLWDSSHLCPHYSSQCVSAPVCPDCGAAALKRPPFAPCFTGTINVPRSSQAPLLSFSLTVIPPLFLLSCALSEVSCLYWMVQKQNHKPISVTLAMRLDGPNLSPCGAIGCTPASLKRPLSSRQRRSFLFGDNCNWALAVHVTNLDLGPSVHVGTRCHVTHVTAVPCHRAWVNCTFSAFQPSFQMIPNYQCEFKKSKAHRRVWKEAVLLHNIEANLWC